MGSLERRPLHYIRASSTILASGYVKDLDSRDASPLSQTSVISGENSPISGSGNDAGGIGCVEGDEDQDRIDSSCWYTENSNCMGQMAMGTNNSACYGGRASRWNISNVHEHFRIVGLPVKSSLKRHHCHTPQQQQRPRIKFETKDHTNGGKGLVEDEVRRRQASEFRNCIRCTKESVYSRSGRTPADFDSTEEELMATDDPRGIDTSTFIGDNVGDIDGDRGIDLEDDGDIGFANSISRQESEDLFRESVFASAFRKCVADVITRPEVYRRYEMYFDRERTSEKDRIPVRDDYDIDAEDEDDDEEDDEYDEDEASAAPEHPRLRVCDLSSREDSSGAGIISVVRTSACQPSVKLSRQAPTLPLMRLTCESMRAIKTFQKKKAAIF